MAVEKIAEKVRVDGPERLLSNGTGLGLSVLQLSNDLINLRTRIANFGRGQFNEEIKRQGRRT